MSQVKEFLFYINRKPVKGFNMRETSSDLEFQKITGNHVENELMKLIFGVTEMNYEDVTVNGTSPVVLNMA